MSTKVTLEIDGVSLAAELNDTDVAGKIAASLPLTISLSRWGDEYYGGCGMGAVSSADDGVSREIMEIGELAYWPPGQAFCIFFGPTPASTDDRPRAASDVVPIGRILDGTEPLKGLGGSATVTITAV